MPPPLAANSSLFVGLLLGFAMTLLAIAPTAESAETDVHKIFGRLGNTQGICVVVEPDEVSLPVRLAEASQLLVYVQSDDAKRVTAMRTAALRAGLLAMLWYRFSRAGAC